MVDIGVSLCGWIISFSTYIRVCLHETKYAIYEIERYNCE